jgi:hypothetical protein
MPNLEGFANHVSQGRRPGWRAVVALMVMGVVACSDSSGAPPPPPAPGSILVTTVTSGFLKAESYALLLDGVSEGTIGANDQVTISGLDPASYQVDLGDVPGNCVVESLSVPVFPDETAEVSLTIDCTFDEPVSYTIQFDRQRPDLDTGEIIVCPFGICSTNEDWDLWVHESTQTDPRSVIRQNQHAEVEIAHLPGVVLAELTDADFEAAEFTLALVNEPFDGGRVILIRTDLGNVYALGNPVENLTDRTLTFDAALIATP